MVPKLFVVIPILLSTIVRASANTDYRSRVVHKNLAKRLGGDIGILDRLFSGARWTFYDAGLGACGETNVESDYIVALNANQFGTGYPGPNCFKTITMKYNGKKVIAKIMDMCPGCPYGALDLSRGLFRQFAAEDVGVVYGEWYFGEDDESPQSGRNGGAGGSGEGGNPSVSTKTPTQTTTRSADYKQSPFSTADESHATNPVFQALNTTRVAQAYPLSGGITILQEGKTAGLALPSAVMSSSSSNATQSNDNSTGNVIALAPNGTAMVPATTTNSSAPAVKDLIANGNTIKQLGNLAKLEYVLGTFGWIAVNAGKAVGR